jgi:hypothetical protein
VPLRRAAEAATNCRAPFPKEAITASPEKSGIHEKCGAVTVSRARNSANRGTNRVQSWREIEHGRNARPAGEPGSQKGSGGWTMIALTLNEIAATASANRKFLAMLASVLVGAGGGNRRMDDDALTLNELAATTSANRKFLVMLASALVSAGVLNLDDLQDFLMEEAKGQQSPELRQSEFGSAVAAELIGLAKVFDPSVLPDPTPPPRGRSNWQQKCG